MTPAAARAPADWAPLRRAVLVFVVAAALALLALWAFVSYLQPSFTGEEAADLLRCG